MKKIYYLYSKEFEKVVDKTKEYLKDKDTVPLELDRLHTLEPDSVSHILVTGTMEQIKPSLEYAHRNDISIGIIPDRSQQELIRTFDLGSNLIDSIKQALKPSDNKIDLLYCDESIVLQEVVIGNAPPLDRFDTDLKDRGLIYRVKLFFKTVQQVKQLQHTKVKLTDANSNEIKLSCVGLVGVEYNNATFAAKLISKQLDPNDGKLSLAILSPTSILQYIGYLFSSLVSRWTPDTLPSSVGYIRSSKIEITSQRELGVLIDSSQTKTTPVQLNSINKALKLSVGEKFTQTHSHSSQTRDSIKVDHLPQDDESASYLGKTIPLFSHASQEQYASLFKNLREESRLSSTFITLLVLASIIATFGLFINSSSVIIGAMLLAPLMQPIVSLSMGALRQDKTLLRYATRATSVGVMIVLLTAMAIALFIPIERVTSEMAGRLSPTILDLAVAIFSGVAAAYAKNNEKILGSLAGVAIAVALVPPIAVAGIGLGWGEFGMFASAFLLFLTNLVGIVLAAVLTFLFLGYSPIHVAKKGIFVWLVLMIIVAFPLYSSFVKIEKSATIQKRLEGLQIDLNQTTLTLANIEPIISSDRVQIRFEAISSSYLTPQEKIVMKRVIEKKIESKAQLLVTFRYKL